MKDKDDHIKIPGFYDRVVAPSPEEAESWKRLPFDEKEYLEHEVGSAALIGEPGFSALERTWIRPSLDVHGMPGGFIGAGGKTVIPAKATAKISMRLVPDMNAAESFAQFKHYIEQIKPPAVKVEVRLIHSGDPVAIRTDSPYIQAATEAMEQVLGKKTAFIRCGGSIPIVGDFERLMKIPTAMMGFGLPDDGYHAPNEKFHIANFHHGIESIILFLEKAAKLTPHPNRAVQARH